MIRDIESGRAASYGDLKLLVVLTRRIDRLGAIERQGFPQGDAKGIEKLIARRLLAIDARNLVDPTDPPVAVLLHDRRLIGFHGETIQ